mgnify:CR=1 FL=1
MYTELLLNFGSCANSMLFANSLFLWVCWCFARLKHNSQIYVNSQLNSGEWSQSIVIGTTYGQGCFSLGFPSKWVLLAMNLISCKSRP